MPEKQKLFPVMKLVQARAKNNHACSLSPLTVCLTYEHMSTYTCTHTSTSHVRGHHMSDKKMQFPTKNILLLFFRTLCLSHSSSNRDINPNVSQIHAQMHTKKWIVRCLTAVVNFELPPPFTHIFPPLLISFLF